jgi:hypothetical protein
VRVSPIYITDVATISHIAGGSSTNGLNDRFPFRSFISSCDPSCRKHQVAFRGTTDFIQAYMTMFGHCKNSNVTSEHSTFRKNKLARDEIQQPLRISRGSVKG